MAASRGYVDEIIAPRESRPKIIKALEILAAKQETRPAKKHGNIPM
jgi:acetyl-CoA carboxylase carboxyltransferase component